MGALFGSSGYRPDQKQVGEMGQALLGGTAPGGLDYFKPQTSYTPGQRPQKSSPFGVNKPWLGGGGEAVTTGESQYQASLPKFKYTPGEMGYKIGEYKPMDYDFAQSLSDERTGLAASQTEAAKAGARAAQQQAVGALGRRGVARGGVGQQALGQVEQRLGGALSDIQRQAGMDIAGFGQQQQQMQAAQNIAAAQYNAQRQQSQAQIDAAMRGERMGYARQPYDDMLKLYQMQMGLAAQPTQGFLGRLGGAVGGIGTAASGIGQMF